MFRAVQITADQQQRIDAWCQRYRVRKLRMVGSVAKGDERPDGNVDLRVEFVAGQTPDAFAVVDRQDELSAVFNGSAIELAFDSVLNNPYRRRAIEPQVRALYPVRGQDACRSTAQPLT